MKLEVYVHLSFSPFSTIETKSNEIYVTEDCERSSNTHV